MEPREISYEELESKYFSELNPDDCVVDAAAVMALSYRYRCDYVPRKRILFTILIVLANVFAAIMFGAFFLNNDFKYFGYVYFILLALWLVLMELGYRAKCKKPDRLQYFFLSRSRLFISNREGLRIIPYSHVMKVRPVKYIGKDKNCCAIEFYYGTNILEAIKLTLHAGAEDGERLYTKLCEMCGGK